MCLHTDPYAPPGSGDVGGMNVVVRHTCDALARAGHRVEVITRWSDPATAGREEIDGVVVHRLAVGPPRTVLKGENEAFMDDFGRELALLGPMDLLHSHHWFSGIAALPVARSWGVPHLQSFHSIAAPESTDLSAGERPESPGRLQGEAFLAQQSDGVLAVSRAEAMTALERLGAPPERLTVVYPGVDSALFHPAPETPGKRSSVLVAARLEPLKGVDLAIRALALLPVERRPLLRIAGGATADASFGPELLELAAGLGLRDDVELLGPQSRTGLADLMRSSTMVMVPSHSETYGLVALEAAASGVPVIASATGGLVEAVRDGTTGLLVQGRRPQDWAAAVDRLLAEPELRERLGRQGREHAVARTWDSVGAVVARAYRGVVVGAGVSAVGRA
ncbi:glycosyltransferase [Serinibacter arcticus]|uniref:glycosyltransferase n=1 Tax=Serinibacter arcticus TaxID=1655435 RepID=UPI001F4025C4|nr:glycosyltransferase [Serinibacter arcticus]